MRQRKAKGMNKSAGSLMGLRDTMKCINMSEVQVPKREKRAGKKD
jgi:hypothetical protein